MIHLFRKIRNELLGDNKLRKYMFYALGEIALVMVGILLALQFSNWNEEKAERKKEAWYLNNIADDLTYQKVILEDMVEYYEESIAIEKSIIKDFSKNFSFSDVDSLDYKLNYLLITYDFLRIDNTYRELISSGQFSLIRDQFLSLDIINYYLLCEANDNDVENDHNNIFYKEVYPIINKYSQVTLEEEDDEEGEDILYRLDPALTLYIKNKLNEPEPKLALINAVKTKLILQENFLDLVNETISINDSLISKIETYLGNAPKIEVSKK